MGGGSLLRPARLRAGDTVRFVSPASTPDRVAIEHAADYLGSLGLDVEIAPHAFDSWGFLAGTDANRIADLNDAIRDPQVRAVLATCGGKGAYRIADQLDVEAVQADPKLLVGFSEITVLHMALLSPLRPGGRARRLLATRRVRRVSGRFVRDRGAHLRRRRGRDPPGEATSTLTTTGIVRGPLIGGNQDSVATAAGWALPSLDGAILLLEGENQRLGHVDRQLTMLINAGHLRGVSGVAVGQYTNCEPDATTQGDWSVLDVLRDRLAKLDVPILGGLPIGHGSNPVAVPVGTMAELNADVGYLRIESATT